MLSRSKQFLLSSKRSGEKGEAACSRSRWVQDVRLIGSIDVGDEMRGGLLEDNDGGEAATRIGEVVVDDGSVAEGSGEIGKW